MAELTVKRELFCQLLATGGITQAEAYAQAHYAVENMSQRSVEVEASRLAAIPKVSLRIQELKDADSDKLAQKRVWDKSRLIDEAEINVTLGREYKQIPASNAALTLIGKLTGELVEQPTGPGSAQLVTQVTVVLNRGTDTDLVAIEAESVSLSEPDSSLELETGTE